MTTHDAPLLPFHDPQSNNFFYFEQEAKSKGYKRIAGLSIEGSKAIAGPLIAAACILPDKFFLEPLKNPSKLSFSQQQKLYHQMISFPGVSYALAEATPDSYLKAHSFPLILQLLEQALSLLSICPDFILLEGLYPPIPGRKVKGIPYGASRSYSLAYSSFLAKITRNAIMDGHDAKWPQYRFSTHKGYPTPLHRLLLKEWGCSPIHHP